MSVRRQLWGNVGVTCSLHHVVDMRLLACIIILRLTAVSSNNLSCYQCERNTPGALCGPEALLPCPPTKDRCVTHIAKDATSGYTLKRECGLGPCTFEDDMITRGLGIFGTCDTSKDEFFCVSCCRTSGCNKDLAAILVPSSTAMFAALLAILALAL